MILEDITMENREDVFMSAYIEVVNNFMRLNRAVVTNQFTGYTHVEVETVDLVGHLDEPNVTKIADETGMTRGGVTKLMNKLVNKDLVVSFQRPNNKKERYFKLTEAGKNLFARHADLHTDIVRRDQQIFDLLKEEELNEMLDFAGKLNQHFEQEMHKLNTSN